MKSALLVGSIFILTIATPMMSYCDTTSDLVAIYNDGIRIPTKEELTEFELQLMEYNKLLEEDKRVKQFNMAVEDASAVKERMLSDANKQIQQLLTEANESAQYITDNIYGDINKLISADISYKTTVEAAQRSLDTVNKYQVPVKMGQLQVDLEVKKSELDELEESIKTPVVEKTFYEFELGDVYEVVSILPIDMAVSSSWGVRLNPVTKTSIDYHNGIDILTPVGTEVKALFNGEVLEAGDNWAFGNFVRIKHGNGIISVYGHLDTVSVVANQVVNQYDVIGKTGQSGNNIAEPCLHLGMFINGQSVNPAILFKED